MNKGEAALRLKKEGNYQAAIRLLDEMVTETEEEARRNRCGVAPWPYEQLAMIHRKLRDYDAEVRVLERFAQQRHPPGKSAERLSERLIRAYELANAIDYRESEGLRVAYHTEHGVPIDLLEVFARVGAIVDVETTGLSGDDELIELAIVLFRFSIRSGQITQILDEYSGLRQPACGISKEATAVHGLTMHDLRGKEIDNERVAQLLGKAEVLFAHNAPFDRRFLAKLCRPFFWKQWHCTMNGVPWTRMGFKSKALHELLRDHNVKIERSHRALDDARAVLQLMSATDQMTGKPYLFRVLSSNPLSFDESASGGQERPDMRITIPLEDDSAVRSPGCGCSLIALLAVMYGLLMMFLTR